MYKKLIVVMLLLLSSAVIPFVAQSSTITICEFDEDTYDQGETGYITVTVYNDMSDKIRVTELTATIDYYYVDENVYLQSFFTNATLPAEILRGQSSTFHISFSLPNNIAPGFTDIHVTAKTELWNAPFERWFGSEHPTYQPTLYIESPYKQQLDEQQTINKNVTTMMYLFGTAAIVFAAVTAFLFLLNRRTRLIGRPIA